MCSKFSSLAWGGPSSLLPSPLQLLGYYVKFATDGENPPLCAVLLEKGVQLMCFPYSHRAETEGTGVPVAEGGEVPVGGVQFAPQRVVPVVDCLVLPELLLFYTAQTQSTSFPTVNRHLLLTTNQEVHLYKDSSGYRKVVLLKYAT